MNTPHEQPLNGNWLRQLGDTLHRMAPRIDQTLTHVRMELANAGNPPAARTDGMPRGNNELTSVEACADLRYRLSGAREQLRDDLMAITALVQGLDQTCATVVGTRLPRLDNSDDRCNGKIDPTCTAIASTHRDATGTHVHGMCDACFMHACIDCYSKARAEGRTRCDACRKRAQRSREVAA